jgi:endo-1,4-beta-xylanase
MRFDGLSRRALLAGMVAAPVGVRAQELLAEGKAACGPAPGLPEGPSLQQAAAKASLLFGSAVKDSLFSTPAYQAIVQHECSVLSCIYSMKFHMLQPKPGEFRFGPADAYVEFARAQGKRMHGHTLIWHEVLPSWVEGALAEAPEKTLVEHITKVVGHYKGRVQSWDVVNEATSGRSLRPDLLRPSPWLEALGPEYIAMAFEAAHAADPQAELVFNTNATSYRTGNVGAHCKAIVRLAEGLLARKVPLHAIGVQGHLDAASRGQFADAELLQFGKRVADMKLKLIVTELDCSDKGIMGNAARDQAVAEAYRQFLDVMLEVPSLQGVICWGLSDRESGHNRWPRPDGTFVRGLPYDVCLSSKPLRDELLRAFGKRI